MASNDLRLARYYATLDDIGIRDAVSLLHEEVHYAIVLPNGTRRGDPSRQGILDYLESRPAVQRRHHLLRTAVDGDTEFVYGAVTDNDTVTGRFAAVARIDDGMIRAYQVTFDLELVVVPSGGGGMSETPFLDAWFEFMDSDRPERVLDLITDDFEMSIQFSRVPASASEFLGDRAGLVAYLEQREVSVLVHHLTHGARVE